MGGDLDNTPVALEELKRKGDKQGGRTQEGGDVRNDTGGASQADTGEAGADIVLPEEEAAEGLESTIGPVKLNHGKLVRRMLCTGSRADIVADGVLSGLSPPAILLETCSCHGARREAWLQRVEPPLRRSSGCLYAVYGRIC